MSRLRVSKNHVKSPTTFYFLGVLSAWVEGFDSIHPSGVGSLDVDLAESIVSGHPVNGACLLLMVGANASKTGRLRFVWEPGHFYGCVW